MDYDNAVESALERKDSPTEYLNWKTRTPEPINCEGCGHPISWHEKRYGCDHESDKWVSGDNCEALMTVRCGCVEHEAETDKLQLALRRAYEELNKER